MSRYSNSKRIVLSTYNFPDFIREIVEKRKIFNPLKIQIPEEEYNPRDVALSFSSECYDELTFDECRTSSYAKWICEELSPSEELPISEKGESKWLEIGPGSNATLSLILLNESEKVEYFGFEINPGALKRCRKILKPFRNVHLFNAFVNSDFNFKKYLKNIDFVLHEIFGVVA